MLVRRNSPCQSRIPFKDLMNSSEIKTEIPQLCRRILTRARPGYLCPGWHGSGSPPLDGRVHLSVSASRFINPVSCCNPRFRACHRLCLQQYCGAGCAGLCHDHWRQPSAEHSTICPLHLLPGIDAWSRFGREVAAARAECAFRGIFRAGSLFTHFNHAP